MRTSWRGLRFPESNRSTYGSEKTPRMVWVARITTSLTWWWQEKKRVENGSGGTAEARCGNGIQRIWRKSERKKITKRKKERKSGRRRAKMPVGEERKAGGESISEREEEERFQREREGKPTEELRPST